MMKRIQNRILSLLNFSDSIRNKIFTVSIIVLIIPLLVITSISGYYFSSHAEKMYLERMNAELIHVNSIISEIVSSARMDLEMLCDTSSFKIIKPDSLTNYSATTKPSDMSRVKRNTQEQQIYSYVKGMNKHHPDYVEIYAGTRYGGFVTSGNYMLRPGYDPRVRPWYKDAEVSSGKTVVAKSYLSVTGDYVTAVVKGIADDSGAMIFAAGIDISLKRLTEIINRIRIGRTGYLVLVERDGTILAHPVIPELNSKNITEAGVPEFRDILRRENYVTAYSFEGKRKVASVFNSPDTGWIFLAIMEQGEINANTRFYSYAMAGTALLIILFCGLLYIYLIRDVLAPLKDITEFGSSVAAGNFEHEMPLERKDEIGKLAQDFNSMMLRLQESAESVKAIIEFMPSIIIQFDTDGRVMEWNKEAERFTGIDIKDARGKMLSEIKPELAGYLWNTEEIIKSEKQFSLYKARIAGLDENSFNLFIFLLKFRESQSFVLRIDDITELEKKDEQLRQSQKMESIGVLASGVAHDFNNILGGILGAVSVVRFRLKKECVDDPVKLDRDLEIVERSCEDGSALASQLLDISRKESDVEFHSADLNDVLNQISRICMKSFDRSISFSVMLFDGRAPAMMNVSQIQQALLNICINAAHAMTIMRKPGEHKGGHLDIGITRVVSDSFFMETHPEAVEGTYWNLSVKDTGVGMDSRTISKIYDPFFTKKVQTSVRGTGLGLSIVYSVVKNHGGFIDVYSEVGIGTVFSIYLPVFNESSVSPAEKKKDSPVTGEGTVLVIDDDEIIRGYTGAMLSECGYSVIHAADGVEGVTLFRQNLKSVRCIILDMVMPVMSGLETLVEIKKIKSDIPVLMASGLKSKEILNDMKNSGANGFIEKPYSMLALSKAVNSAINDTGIWEV